MPNGFEITSMSMEVNDDFKAAFSDPRRQHFLGVIRYFTKYLVLLVRSFFPILAGLAISDGLRQYAEVIGWGIFTLVVLLYRQLCMLLFVIGMWWWEKLAFVFFIIVAVVVVVVGRNHHDHAHLGLQVPIYDRLQ